MLWPLCASFAGPGCPRAPAASLKRCYVPAAALFNDSSSEATFLAVPDVRLGTGATVFDQAHLRFLQHTVAGAKIKVLIYTQQYHSMSSSRCCFVVLVAILQTPHCGHVVQADNPDWVG